jgi:enamine deaminase RidA (YjgF/YER057c/UK114 family)
MGDVQALLEKIQSLPEERLAEVESFVNRLAEKAKRQAAFDRFLAVAPALEAAGMPPMTEDEIQAEIDAVRAERRKAGGADRP